MKKLLTILSLISTVAATCYASQKSLVDVAVENSQFSTLVTALRAADLIDVVKNGDFTILAPDNNAFEKLDAGALADLLKPENKERLTDILTYHVIPGKKSLAGLLEARSAQTVQGQKIAVRFNNGKIEVESASLTTADINCKNGVIHVIDRVLIPPATLPGNLAETAAAAGNFNTLLAAAKAAGLDTALAGKGPLTIFAPTDEAFGKIPQSTIQDLLKPENKLKLSRILKYHVIAGNVRAGDALNAGEASTLTGDTLAIAFRNGRLEVNKSQVLSTDIKSSNGIIHVIDQVLMPPEKSLSLGIREAAAMIEQAIEKGVPAFNSGDPHACARIYMEVSNKLQDEEGLPQSVRNSLKHALKNAAHSTSAHDQAWALRHGLDRAYTMLQLSGREEVSMAN